MLACKTSFLMLDLGDDDSLVNFDRTLDARVKVWINAIVDGVGVVLGICDMETG